MNRASLSESLQVLLYPSYRARLTLLMVLALFCVFPGAFLSDLPLEGRLGYAYALSGLMAANAYCQLIAWRGIGRVALALLFGRRHPSREYEPRGLGRLARSMGLKKPPKVRSTGSPWITSALTNALTGTIYIPDSWRAKFSTKEILATLGHELAHLGLRRKFFLEFFLAAGVVAGAALLLSLSTALIVVQIFEVTLFLLLLTVVSWRNEYHADIESAKAAGPEGLISVLEWLRAESQTDEGSETHPPLGDRIHRLVQLLDAP